MALSLPLYCQRCGAANQAQAIRCFACDKSLHTSYQEPMLKQRYRLLAPVGQGGFGIVYKAEDAQCENRPVAIKDFHVGALSSQEMLEATDAFKREVFLLANLKHSHLPRLHDYFRDAEHWYLVRDFITGETLEEYLDKSRAGYLPWQEVLTIGIQLCNVLHYLHTQEPPIIFRDLKPANIMRTSTGHLYLIDFGIARHFKPGQARDTMALGSPGYAAPEQYGKAQTTPQADIYSLGAILHRLLTGNDPAQTPFRFEHFAVEAQVVPARLWSLLRQMVVIDANNRPASVTAVKHELEQVAASSKPCGTTLSTYREHGRLVLALAWSPDGTSIVSGSSDGSMHIWETANGRNTFTYRDPSKWYAWACSLAWSSDGTCIASGGDDKTVQIWQVNYTSNGAISLKPSFTYQGHTNWVTAVAWSPDNQRILSASDDTTVHIWQPGRSAADNLFEIYRGHSRWVVTAAWSPGGASIASGGNDTTVHVWDAATKRTLHIYRKHPFGVNALTWSPDGKYIASCCWDNNVHVWEAATGNVHTIYQEHTLDVKTLAWSPDGRRIASAGKDNTVHIWDATTGNTLYIYHGHSRWVYALAWSPDGTRIASGGSDKTVQIWHAGE
ncbi:MAG: protein kinase domain-containing protein [Ktedonobacteraceae bacterium]